MADTLRVREHGHLPVGVAHGLSEAQVDYLEDLRRRRRYHFFDVSRGGGGWRVRFRQHVGAIALPGGQTLEILPKLDEAGDDPVRQNLMRMLAETGMAPGLEGDLGHYAACGDLIEAYLRLACELCWKLLHGGLPKSYERRELTTPFIKGRWMVARQLTRHAGRRDRHDVSLDILTEDTPHGRFLKAGVSAILRVARTEKTQQLARALRFTLDGLGNDPLTMAAFRRLHFDRRQVRWRPLLRLMAQIGEEMPSQLAAGRAALGPAWLFDMNRVFEAYIARRLRRIHDGPVRVQRPRRHLLRDAAHMGAFELRPDIVVGDPPEIILDTKWKRLGRDMLASVHDADVRQVFAYGKIYRVPRVILLYPAAREERPPVELLSHEREGLLGVTIAEVPVGLGQKERLDDRLRRLLAGAPQQSPTQLSAT